MNYSKIEASNYNLHIIKTDKFKTITVKVNLKRKIKKNEITKRNMLVNALLESTKNLKSKRLMEIKTEELYDLGYRASNYASGKYTILCVEASYINKKYIPEDIDEESFRFLGELLFNPDIDNNSYNEKSYLMSRNIMEEHLSTLKENVVSYAQMRMLEEMNEDIVSYRNSGYIEDLDDIDAKALSEYYNDIINNDTVDIFVIGDIEEDYIKGLVDKYLPFKNNKKDNESHFYKHSNVDENIKFRTEKINREQSTLIVGFKIDELSDFERKYVLSCYNYILGGSTDSNLFRTVREENSLCYYINSSSQPLLNLNIIKSGINSNDYEQTIFLINKEIENMKSGNFESERLENAKKAYINSLEEIYDNPDNILSIYMSKEYLDSDLVEKRKEEIVKVTAQNVVNISNKIHLNTIFLLEGSEDDE